MTTAGFRHLTREGLADYLAAGGPAIVKVDGTPPVYLVIEPAARTLAIRTPPARLPVPDLSLYKHISTATVYWNDAAWCELRVGGVALLDAYPILCAVADRVQIDRMDFAAAVVSAVDAFKEVLAGFGRLSEQQEVGLFGELLVLNHLLTLFPRPETIRHWRGPDGEEHDFEVGDEDIEIKSTTAEESRHWIGDVRQLQPTAARRLWLLSIQLTGAGAGGASLPELIAQVEQRLHDPSSRDAFRGKLVALNWRDDLASLYTRRFRLRSVPEVFAVDETFPAITPARLELLGVDQSRIVRISYMIDLMGLPPSCGAPPFLDNIGTEASL